MIWNVTIQDSWYPVSDIKNPWPCMGRSKKLARYLLDMSCTLLHHGHVRIIASARSLMPVGAQLVVSLTKDEEVFRTKGYIPELNLSQRKEILIALSNVDAVIEGQFIVTDAFLDANDCEFLIHGDDNVNQVSPHRMIILPRTAGVSSFDLRKTAFQNYLLQFERIRQTQSTSLYHEPLLFITSPLSTAMEVKVAMLYDYGPNDQRFLDISSRTLDRLVEIVNGRNDYVCIPFLGDSTTAVEAMLVNFVSRTDKVLVLVNGAMGRRIVEICKANEISYRVQEFSEDSPVCIDEINQRLLEEDDISHVAMSHCETKSGVFNPLVDVGRVTQRTNKRFLVDASSTFGAFEIESEQIMYDGLVASSEECLEGVPGISFCITRRERLPSLRGNTNSGMLNLYAQWQAIEKTGEWRFTPPTHIMLALATALDRLDSEGGWKKRGKRYRQNYEQIVSGMRAIGFSPISHIDARVPITATFDYPSDPLFDLEEFSRRLSTKGFIIDLDKGDVGAIIRISCRGAIGALEIANLLETARSAVSGMGFALPKPSAG
jgi:2-aminoethylphosphonate-pyruvate transaminase